LNNSKKDNAERGVKNSSEMVIMTQAEFADAIRDAKSEAWEEVRKMSSLPDEVINPYMRAKPVEVTAKVARSSARGAVEVAVSWALTSSAETLHAFTSIDTRALCGVGKRTPNSFNSPFGSTPDFCIDCFREYNLLVQTQGDGAKNENNHGIFV